MDFDTDVVVVGAGPCGLAAAIAIERAGWRALVFDASCVVSSIAGYPTYLTFFSTAERIEIGGMPFVVATEKPTRRDALAYYREVVERHGLIVRQYERVEQVERAGDGFLVHSRPRGREARTTTARAIVIATGYFDSPNYLGVPGEDLPHVTHRYREGHEAFMRDAIVVGGKNSAAEAALDLYRSGARVTMVYHGDGLSPSVKPWVAPDLQNRITEGHIGTRWRSRVVGIERGEIVLETPHGTERLPADHVYLLTGYTPEHELLRRVGAAIDPETGTPVHDPATMETDVPGVFIAGVISAGNDANKVFIENGRGHGELIARRLTAMWRDPASHEAHAGR
ncbi:MAG TPA: YpdA family putative bacillithiol disulfide reductase [Gemmatimonadaceae bacterium]